MSSMGQREVRDALPSDSAGTAAHLILVTESLERVKLVCADQPERQVVLQGALDAHKREEVRHGTSDIIFDDVSGLSAVHSLHVRRVPVEYPCFWGAD